MKKIFAIIVAAICLLSFANAQNMLPKSGRVGVFTTYPNTSAALDIDTTGLGLLIPRMSKAERDAIAGPATGLLIYQTNSAPGFYYFNGNAWTPVTPKSANSSLSNLAANTAVNQHLSPGLDTLDLGNKNFLWRKIFVSDGLYSGSSRLFKADSNNTGVGTSTLIASTGTFNTAVGADAMRANTNGVLNAAVGASALLYNTTGSGNTATGTASLTSNTTGNFNTASGYAALASNTVGSYNVASGDYALHGNTTGYSNVAIGTKALYKNTTGSNLVAVGDSALLNNFTGYSNVAIGTKALKNNTSGFSNTAVGDSSLLNNSAGQENVAMGNHSLQNNTSGDYNTGLGYYSLYSNIDGYLNIGLGHAALLNNKHGAFNTAAGYTALYFSDGDNNAAFGYQSLSGNNSGSYNSAFGSDANVLSKTLVNATAIGAKAWVDASNKVQIGSTGVTSIGGQVGWTTFSDGRYKKNIKENVPGLAFINALRPITYTVDVSGLNNYFESNKQKISHNDPRSPQSDKILQDGYDKASKVIHTGFIAQEVEAVANKLGYDFNGVDKPEDKNKTYGLRYDEFVVPLVKAVQQLSKMNDDKDARMASQDEKIDGLQKQINELKALLTTNSSTSSATEQLISFSQMARLEQSQPNPTSSTTTIKYFVPEQNSKAIIKITNSNGQEIKLINITAKSGGQLALQTNQLIPGTYFYSLIIDGKTVDTKKMLIAH